MLIPNPAIPIKVIFEDESIIVINKPAGIPCLPLKAGEGKTLANGIAARWPDAELVHRLDNDTSGLIIASKNPGALKDLRLQFDDEKVLKEYTALVLGEPPPKGIIETPIIHDLRNKKKMKVAKAGQPTRSTYEVEKRFMGGQYTLLKVRIKTGVRHQIRVHLASVGHPIAGDRLYQNSRQRGRDRLNLSRHFLHASHIGFVHPATKKWLEFNCKLPEELLKGVIYANDSRTKRK